MEPRFTIDLDPQHCLLRVVMSGFFAADDVRQLAAARDAAYARLPCPVGDHVTLIDIRGMKIQSQDCGRAFAMAMADPSTHSRRLAFVVESGLARMQLSRVSDGRGAQFRSVAEAEAWLLAPADAAVAG